MTMCRSIKKLRVPDHPATEVEIRAAALQFVRKVSGYHTPSQASRAAFDKAVDEVSGATQALLAVLPPARAASSAATKADPVSSSVRESAAKTAQSGLEEGGRQGENYY